jgi:hypothetical protein
MTIRTYAGCDVYRFMESLKYRPETYHTILLEQFDNRNTETSKVRRKVSRFVNQGLIASGLLDGEGKKVFYSLEKQYFIIIARTDGHNMYYYCSHIDDNVDDPESLVLYNAFILRGDDWEYLGNIALKRAFIERWF